MKMYVVPALAGLLMFLAPSHAAKVNPVMVDESGVVVRPSNFAEANEFGADTNALVAATNGTAVNLSIVDGSGNDLYASANAIATIVHPDGSQVNYTDFYDAVDATTNDCVFMLLQDVELTDNFGFLGDNITVLGFWNTATVTMSGTGTDPDLSGWAAAGMRGDNSQWINFNVRAKFVAGFNPGAFPYAFVFGSSSCTNTRVYGSTIQLENYIDQTGSDTWKTFVSVGANKGCTVEDCNIVGLNLNSRLENEGCFVATHDRLDAVQFINCRFIGGAYLKFFAANDNTTFDVTGCQVNLSQYLQHSNGGDTHVFQGLGFESAMHYVIPGTESLFVESESTADVVADQTAGRVFYPREFQAVAENPPLTSAYNFGSGANGYRTWGVLVASNDTSEVFTVPISSADIGGATDFKVRILYLSVEETTLGSLLSFYGFDSGSSDYGSTPTYSGAVSDASVTIGSGSDTVLEWGDWVSATAAIAPLSNSWVGYYAFGNTATAPSQKYLIMGFEIRAE